MLLLSIQMVKGGIITSSPTCLSSSAASSLTLSAATPTPTPSLLPLLSKGSAAASNTSTLLTCCSRVCEQQVSATVGSHELQSSHTDDDHVKVGHKHPPPARNQSESDGADSDSDSVLLDGGNQSSDGGGVSRIGVPRPRYISIPKARLLEAILSHLFDSQLEAHQFLHLSKCLDSILLAEHKNVLEDMRVDYDDLTHSLESQATNHQSSFRKSFLNGKKSFALGSEEEEEQCQVDKIDQSKPDFLQEMDSMLGFFSKNAGTSPSERVAVHNRFQRAFVKLLYNAEFEELSVRDLLLTSALNTDYLLTLPIHVDWRKASESNTIIYRRGYATERQKGLLTGEKLDYLQSMLLQRILFLVSRPLGKLGVWLTEALNSNKQMKDAEPWMENLKLWLKKILFFQQSYSYNNLDSSMMAAKHGASDDLPIWLAAQRAVTRYEGILSTVGPRGRLLRRLLTWIGLAPSTPEQAIDLMSGRTGGESGSLSRPIFLSRISIGDIWKPASLKSCGNDFWATLKTAISIFFSQSTLQEPAFKELILLYTEEVDATDTEIKAEIPPLQLKIYEEIPIPDLPVVFPHKKLSFRILDTVRLDAATILGLSAYFINYKFEDILSSPSAILLDIIAVSALVIYVFRVVWGYKQTWDRYQLLVNRTLYEKTVASGFGSVHFLLDASQQQQYKEAILAYAILLKGENCQTASVRSLRDKCEKFVYEVFNEKIEMPVDKAKDTLLRLGLVTETGVGEESLLRAISCSKAAEILRRQWSSLLA